MKLSLNRTVKKYFEGIFIYFIENNSKFYSLNTIFERKNIVIFITNKLSMNYLLAIYNQCHETKKSHWILFNIRIVSEKHENSFTIEYLIQFYFIEIPFCLNL